MVNRNHLRSFFGVNIVLLQAAKIFFFGSTYLFCDSPGNSIVSKEAQKILEISSLPILRVPVRSTYDEQEIAGQILIKIRNAKWTAHADGAA